MNSATEGVGRGSTPSPLPELQTVSSMYWREEEENDGGKMEVGDGW